MTADEQGYNGHKNYETWAVSMFLDGNYDGEMTYRAAVLLAEGMAERDAATHQVADALRQFVEARLPDLGASLAGDLLGACMGEVDWHRLAENQLAAVAS